MLFLLHHPEALTDERAKDPHLHLELRNEDFFFPDSWMHTWLAAAADGREGLSISILTAPASSLFPSEPASAVAAASPSWPTACSAPLAVAGRNSGSLGLGCLKPCWNEKLLQSISSARATSTHCQRCCPWEQDTQRQERGRLSQKLPLDEHLCQAQLILLKVS